MVLHTDGSYTLTQAEYEKLLDRDAKLSALEAGGVDCWEWYGESLREYWTEKEGEDCGSTIGL